MNFGFARRLVEDSYFHRLCRDLERQKKRRKINRDRYEIVMAVNRLPKTVPESWCDTISQPMLDQAHEMASLIDSNLNTEWLEYDCEAKIVMLHGSYGSRQ